MLTRLHCISIAALVAAAVGCRGSTSGPEPYNPVLPRSWAAAVTNPYFPLVPGTRWEYAGESDDGPETTVVEVLAARRMVNGVEATVVRDRTYLSGELVEDTDDWFAQDDAGNVWYLGEASKEIENGQVVSTEGSWEWGAGGALPGIIMWGDPAAHLNESYRQEYFRNEAEDWGKVVATNVVVTVPQGTHSGCVRTEDWNALERGARENKYYCPNVGLVLETVPSSTDRVELVTLVRP